MLLRGIGVASVESLASMGGRFDQCWRARGQKGLDLKPVVDVMEQLEGRTRTDLMIRILQRAFDLDQPVGGGLDAIAIEMVGGGGEKLLLHSRKART